MKYQGNFQIPVAISFAYLENKVAKSFVVLINKYFLLFDKDKAILAMWKDFYERLESLNLGEKLVIYSHNLGAFDGYFILPSLLATAADPENDINRCKK